LTAFVAVLSTIGVHVHWYVSVLLAAIVFVGGGVGRIVAGINAGFYWGIWGSIVLVILSIVLAPLLMALLPAGLFYYAPPLFWAIYCVVAVVCGGMLGGFTARPRPRQ
jgi:hypothetical protein